MWPAAFLILAVAITESYRHLSGGYTLVTGHCDSDSEKLPDVWPVRSGVEGYEDVVGVMEKQVGWGWGFTIGVEVVAVGLVTFGWYLWPREDEHEKEE
jgi:hypothetical protein